jgi:molybdopterin-guanine dinucleotide biosynthesis protein A
MGRDKALLPFGSGTLAEHVARQVYDAAGSVTWIGCPERYAALGWPGLPDKFPDCGPLGGLCTALSETRAEWNLIVACDMPFVETRTLEALFQAAREPSENVCVAPLNAAGQPEPLCAVYHSSCLAAVEQALRERRLKMRALLEGLETRPVPGLDCRCFTNVNTPEQWLGCAQ